MKYLVLLIVVLFLCLVLVPPAKTETYEAPAPPYRIGNIIGIWYYSSHGGAEFEPLEPMSTPHKNTFGEYIYNKKPSHMLDSATRDALIASNHTNWWDSMDRYKQIYPQFNNSLREAIKSYTGWEKCTMGPDTCVIHVRIGDFIGHRTILPIDDVVKATDELPRIPKRIEILNGGIGHNNPSAESIAKSIETMDELERKLKDKWPNAEVVRIKDTTPDADFWRMVNAPMLVTGHGSFATMACAANENFRISSGTSIHSTDDRRVGRVYENWYNY